METPVADNARSLLRHRGNKVIREASPEFAQFRIAETVRTPVEILAHIGDLFEWAMSVDGNTSVGGKL